MHVVIKTAIGLEARLGGWWRFFVTCLSVVGAGFFLRLVVVVGARQGAHGLGGAFHHIFGDFTRAHHATGHADHGLGDLVAQQFVGQAQAFFQQTNAFFDLLGQLIGRHPVGHQHLSRRLSKRLPILQINPQRITDVHQERHRQRGFVFVLPGVKPHRQGDAEFFVIGLWVQRPLAQHLQRVVVHLVVHQLQKPRFARAPFAVNAHHQRVARGQAVGRGANGFAGPFVARKFLLDAPPQ